MSAARLPIIRRATKRRLDAKEIARLDSDALRQRRRRAAQRTMKAAKRPPPILPALAASGLIICVLIASGSLRLDFSSARAEPRAAAPVTRDDDVARRDEDRALFARLDEISDNLTRLHGDLKSKPRTSVVKAAAAPPRPAAAPQRAAISLEDRNTWRAPRGAWSSDILRGWSERAGVDLDWQADIDIQLEAPVEVAGNFEEAVASLLDGLAHKTPRPKGQLHLNRKTGRPALVVIAEGNPDG